LQSHAGEIQLLPALPKAWPTGKVTGLRARGNLDVDIQWQDGKLVQVTLHPKKDGAFKVRCPDKVVELKLKAGKAATLK
jgi:alpha-L-fucosidase 2